MSKHKALLWKSSNISKVTYTRARLVCKLKAPKAFPFCCGIIFGVYLAVLVKRFIVFVHPFYRAQAIIVYVQRCLQYSQSNVYFADYWILLNSSEWPFIHNYAKLLSRRTTGRHQVQLPCPRETEDN